MHLDRRTLLRGSCAGLLATLTASRLAFAQAPGEARFVFVFLRGGLDGLHALAPWADADYRVLRPRLHLGGDAVHDLDGYFGLHAGLGALMPLWQAGELALIPAASTRYRDRSHFDGQAMLENGSGRPMGAADGWLNRAITALNGGDRRLGLSLGPSVPLILQGAAPVQSWSNEGLPDLDDDFLQRLGLIYRGDPVFDAAFRTAQGAPEPDMAAIAALDDNAVIAARAVGDILAHPQGPRIAVMEMQGWDTHIQQGWRLDGLFRRLAEALLAMRSALEPVWGQTVVMVASEFGRTAAENGAEGTDHGTGGLAMLLGGAVRGGRIVGDWPGLSRRALFEDRDLRAVNDYEAVFKTILTAHLGLPEGITERIVFPGGAGIAPMDGLLRI